MLKTTSSSPPWTDLSNNVTFSQVSISCDSPLKSYLPAIGQTVPGYFVLSKSHTSFPFFIRSHNIFLLQKIDSFAMYEYLTVFSTVSLSILKVQTPSCHGRTVTGTCLSVLKRHHRREGIDYVILQGHTVQATNDTASNICHTVRYASVANICNQHRL